MLILSQPRIPIPPHAENPFFKSVSRKTSKIVHKQFRNPDQVGLCHDSGLIEIDPRQLAKDYLDTLIHELLHRHFPELSETKVEHTAHKMAKAIWERNFRLVSA